MDALAIIKLRDREKSSSERGNFNDRIQTASEWCNPPMSNINRIEAKGQRKDQDRLIDIGIKARRMFTAGMMSHLFPQGQHWLKINTTDKSLMENDNVIRALSIATKKFMSAIEESNFYEEMGKSVDDLGWAGTTSMYVEGDKKTKLNYRSHAYKEFYFCNDSRGRMDTYIRDFKLNAKQACGEFGDDAPDKCKEDYEAGRDKEYEFIHIVMPRKDVDYGSADKKKKPWASVYVCVNTKEIIKESGFDWMPYSVGGMYKSNNGEKYFRSPAMEVDPTFSVINRMEVTRMRSAERVSNPPWLAPNSGSVRRISNDQGAIIYWDAANPLSKPEQLNPSDNPMVNDDMIMKKEQEVLDAFFIPLFNPLHDKKNMSATESVERLNLSLQFITPAVNSISKYFVKPTLESSFMTMKRDGYFPELEIPELSEAGIEFELVGKAALAARQIELFGTMTAIEQTGMIGQVKPEVWDNWNADRTARFLQEANMVPVALQASEEERDGERQVRQQMMMEERARQNALAAGEAYAKTTKAPEPGSGAEELQGMLG